MTSRRKSSTKRSLSLRSSSFIRLISPFRGARAVREGADSSPPSPSLVHRPEGRRLQSALSDSNLASWDRRRSQEQDWVSQQELRFRGPAVAPSWESQPSLNTTDYSNGNNSSNNNNNNNYTTNYNQTITMRAPGTGTLLRRANASISNSRIEEAWARTKGASLLGRSAVSYQNIGPSGEVFGEQEDLEKMFPGYRAPGRVGPVMEKREDRRGGFSEVNKSTTNVAWLVGSNRKEREDEHHIDIRDQGDLQPPSHLAVAPINIPSSPRLGVKALAMKKNSTSSSTPSPPAPSRNDNKISAARQAGYSLARSKTVSDIPIWAEENPSPKRGRSSSSERLYARGPTSTATVSTLGSLRSRIVKHKTLLGSSSRLYKFSQSLSSLTTITSGDSRTSTLSRDQGTGEKDIR